MQIRLHGTRPECAEAAHRLAEAFAVVSTRGPYPDREGALVRVYVEIRLPASPATTADPADGQPRTAGQARPRRRARRAPEGATP